MSQKKGAGGPKSVYSAEANLRAVNADGKFLHMNGVEFTNSEFWAWRGTPRQFAEISKNHDGLRLVEIRKE